jgi:hypothetical protein
VISEKVYYRAWVTADCLTGCVGGPDTVFKILSRKLELWAIEKDLFLLTQPEVHVIMPELDDPYYGTSVKVIVLARAARVTILEREVWGGHLC